MVTRSCFTHDPGIERADNRYGPAQLSRITLQTRRADDQGTLRRSEGARPFDISLPRDFGTFSSRLGHPSLVMSPSHSRVTGLKQSLRTSNFRRLRAASLR